MTPAFTDEKSYNVYCCFYTITYSGGIQKHAGFVTVLCRVCSMYCSSMRSTAPTYQCNIYFLCMLQKLLRYQTAMRLCKTFRHFTNLFDCWKAHADQNCTFFEHTSSIRKGRHPLKKKHFLGIHFLMLFPNFVGAHL